MDLQSGLVYGPVRSRRLGMSLGVNLSPPGRKTCNFNCAYCQYGWTDFPVRGAFPPSADVIEAVDRALERYGGPPPELWLYRGAWEEWPVADADVLVPLSEEELRLKISAIFKHQSQKDRAPFPGVDEREFWQRVEERNRNTARVVDQLGLPEYFAMEALVVSTRH